MKKWMPTYLMIGTMIASTGCGDDLSNEDIAKAFAAIGAVTAEGAIQAATSALTIADQSAVDFTFNCQGGGTADFGGDFVGASTGFNFMIGFNGCVSQNITIDGTLAYILEFETDGTTSTSTWDYEGDLEFDGDVSGSCVIDMMGSSTTNTQGGQTTGTVSWSGSMCGQNANDALSGSASF